MFGNSNDKAKILKNVINFFLEIAYIQVFSFFTNKTWTYQPCGWVCSESEAKKRDQGGGAVHQDSCLERVRQREDDTFDFWYPSLVWHFDDKLIELKQVNERLPARASKPRRAWIWRIRGCSRSWWGYWWCPSTRGGRSQTQRWGLTPCCCQSCDQWQTYSILGVSVFCSESCFHNFRYTRKVGDKNLPIRRNVVDGAKPIKSRPAWNKVFKRG